MDNLTHTLAGLALAEAGLRRTSRLATATLIVAANLPDVDGLAYLFGGSIDGLSFRRGWTHGALAMVLLPPFLVTIMLGWDRLRGRQPGLQARWLLVLAAIGVWSHPLLDLLNTYGVRLLMPFSPRWFYGDALFIIDPWLWLTLLLGIVLSQRRRRASPHRATREGRPARLALGVAAVYALVMALASSYGARSVERLGLKGQATRILASPVFGNPFRRDVVRELGENLYERGSLRLVPLEYTVIGLQQAGRRLSGAAAAAKTPAGAAFLAWARFPVFRYRPAGDSLDVSISDARYEGRGNGSWASVTVRVAAAQPKERM